MSDERTAERVYGTVIEPPSVPVRGYRVRAEDGQQWIRDPDGTWIISDVDIVKTSSWDGGTQLAEGEPVTVYVRDGADILEVKRYRIERRGRPVTVGDPQQPRTVAGQELMNNLASNLVRHLGVPPGAPGEIAPMRRPDNTTVCCYGGDWGVICEDDDCGYG